MVGIDYLLLFELFPERISLSMNLEGKKVVLTGASSGLGAAIAKSLIQKNANVFGLARNRDKLNALQKELGAGFVPVVLDISDEKNVADWIQQTFSDETLPDVLINNAGVGFFSPIDETSTESWLAMVNTNLNGMYYVTSKLVPFLKKNQKGAYILNIGSVLGTTGRADSAGYSATKYAVRGFSDSLFKELRDFHIKVTCINSGSIETDFFQTSGIAKHENMLHPEDLARTIVHVLETPDNMLINELEVRPLVAKPPKRE